MTPFDPTITTNSKYGNKKIESKGGSARQKNGAYRIGSDLVVATAIPIAIQLTLKMNDHARRLVRCFKPLLSLPSDTLVVRTIYP